MTTLVLGPSLGTSAAACWGPTIALLAGDLDVVAWELPGHGQDPGPAPADLTVADLAARVLDVVDGPFVYAGDSIGGEVGLQLLLDAPDRVLGAVLCCTGARIGDEEMWDVRIAQVRASGTASLVTASAERWFGEGFLEREPARASALLHALRDATDEGYVAACRALRSFDVRHRLGEIAAPVVAVAGAQDRDLSAGGAPADRRRSRPRKVGRPRRRRPPSPGRGAGECRPDHPRARPGGVSMTTYDDGMAVRREVLGDDHVDRATGEATDLTQDFQQLITEYAWGAVWTRAGLDRRTRSLITITALVALGHHEELALHLRGALRNGVSVEEIKETLLHSAVYCGVPAANTAFRIAQQTFAEIDGDTPTS